MKIQNKLQGEKMQKYILSLAIALFILPMVFAATSMTAPVTNGNYTTSLTVTIGVNPNGANNMTNVTCYYNASGGAASTYFLQILNTTTSQTTFTGVGTLPSDTTTYNISCNVYNGTSLNKTLSVAPVTIDGTAPVVSLSQYSSDVDLSGLQKLTWSSSDATSGLNTVTTTVTSPSPSTCPTQTWTTTSATDQLVPTTALGCDGTYTALVTAVDYSGNIGTATKTFNVVAPGYKSNSALGSAGSQASTQANKGVDTKVIVIAIVIIVLYFFVLKKK